MFVALQNAVTMHCNLLTGIQIARETGYAAIEINDRKLKQYLAQGYTLESLLPRLKDVPPVALAHVRDIEREEPAEFEALLKDCEQMCTFAEELGCPMVQLLTGPLDPYGTYKGLTGRAWPEVRKVTARNLKVLGGIGKAHGVKFFLEPLTWTPLHKLEHALEAIDASECDNLGLTVDFWHMWDSGATADQIAKLNKDLIYCAFL
jgi:sugar phosphate isomerase/epimerase